MLAACREPRPAGAIAFDFVQGFDLATSDGEVLHIAIGTPAARPLLASGWSVDETTPDGRPFAWSDGGESSLDFFLARPRPLSLRLRCEPLVRSGLPSQGLTVAVNGSRLAGLTLVPGPRLYQVRLPAEALVAGTNRLVFRYGWTRRPADDGAGSSDLRNLAVAWFEVGFGEDGEPSSGLPEVEEGRALRIPSGSQVAYHLRLPEGSSLSAESVEPGPRGNAALAVLVQPDGGPERELARLTRSVESWSAPLGLTQGGFVRVVFRALPASRGPGVGSVRLVRPVLRRSDAPSAPASPSRSPSARRPHVFVYLVDALRADHLGCYGHRGPVSPAVDAFAREATVFRGIASSSWTKASVASLLTGQSPIVHRAQDRNDELGPEAVTLAERLGPAGYRTYALYANSYVSPTFGVDQGFEERVLLDARSDRLNRDLFARLRRLSPEERLFAYVHTIDPHAPYDPTPDFRKRFAPPGSRRERVSILWLEDLAARARRGEPVPPGLVQEVTALYDAEIAFNDRQFGLFLDELKRLGLYDDSLVVFTADHGEEFLEHGVVSHGQTLFREALEVPLIIKWPSGTAPPPGAGGTLAGLIDVAPTVLDLVGLPSPPEIEGQSLLRARPAGARPGGSGILSYLDLDGRRFQSVTQDGWKLIRAGTLDDPRAPLHLYDLGQGTETRDVAGAHPVVAAHLASQLRAAIARRPAAPAPPQAVLPPEMVERLRALGYVH